MTFSTLFSLNADPKSPRKRIIVLMALIFISLC